MGERGREKEGERGRREGGAVDEWTRGMRGRKGGKRREEERGREREGGGREGGREGGGREEDTGRDGIPRLSETIQIAKRLRYFPLNLTSL